MPTPTPMLVRVSTATEAAIADAEARWRERRPRPRLLDVIEVFRTDLEHPVFAAAFDSIVEADLSDWLDLPMAEIDRTVVIARYQQLWRDRRFTRATRFLAVVRMLRTFAHRAFPGSDLGTDPFVFRSRS